MAKKKTLVFQPEIWNSDQVKKTHNCYSFATNCVEDDRKKTMQPGSIAGIPKLKKPQFSCANILDHVKKDIPSITKIESNSDSCPKGMHKVVLVVHPKKDYHFYRQDDNGMYSHKRGKLLAINVDADDKLIEDPLTANRTYTNYDYTDFCGYLCFPSKCPTKSGRWILPSPRQ